MDGSQRLAKPSFAGLLGGIANDAKDLLSQEVALTKLELQYELLKAKTAATPMGVGIGFLAMGGMLLMLMAAHLLAAFTVVPLWGCYGIVGSPLVLVGGILLFKGKTTLKEVNVVPPKTVERVKETAQWLTKQTTSDKL